MLIKKDVLVLNGQKLVQSKTAEEMADQFGFNADQREQIENMRLCPLPTPKPSGIFSEMLSWKEDDHLV